MKILLASGSPRRLELLRNMGFSVRVCPSGADESCSPDWTAEKTCLELALKKARAVASLAEPDEYVVAADTGVYFEGKLLGKPKDADDARRMLSGLSGNVHSVYTGVAVVRGNKEFADLAVTEVEFAEIPSEDVESYVKGGTCADKAGAYGIQEPFGMRFVKGIKGDYFNVVGLPVNLLCEILTREFNVEI